MYRIVLQAVLYFGEKHDPRFGYSVISEYSHIVYTCTVKPALSGHSKIDKTKILITNGSLVKVESIAEFSPWSIL